MLKELLEALDKHSDVMGEDEDYKEVIDGIKKQLEGEKPRRAKLAELGQAIVGKLANVLDHAFEGQDLTEREIFRILSTIHTTLLAMFYNQVAGSNGFGRRTIEIMIDDHSQIIKNTLAGHIEKP